MKIGVVIRSRDEDRIICDWVKHYKYLKFDKIIIFDMNSHNLIEEQLRKKNLYFGEDLIVIRKNYYVDFPNCLIKENYNLFNDLDWLLLCDNDEFLHIDKNISVKDFLSNFGENVSTILINWVTFGTSKRNNYDYSKSVFEQFYMRENYNSFWNKFVKSFIRPKLFINKIDNFSSHIIKHNDYIISNVYNENISKCLEKDNCSYIDNNLSDNTPAILIHFMTLDFENMTEKRNKYITANINIQQRYTKDWYYGIIDPVQGFKDNNLDKRFFKYAHVIL